MLVFIIPLRSKKVSNSWETVSKLLERTLHSIGNQTSSDFRVIVVCHERPELQDNYPNLEFVDVKFPVPAPSDTVGKCGDQERKLRVGAHHAATIADSYLMFVDSDDCVRKDLAEFVNQHQNCNGWFFDQGYEYQDGKKRIRLRKKGFHQICGTCSIIRTDLVNRYIEELQLLSTDFNQRRLFHTEIIHTMASRDTPLEPLPFPGAVYITNNSENLENQDSIVLKNIGRNLSKLSKFYAMRLFKLMTSQSVSHTLREQFKLHNI